MPGKSHGRRSLVGCSPWGREESDMTERLHFHFSLSCIGEGNGNPLQCSCLENPSDGGAWWAAVYGVAQSRTRLKWLSSNLYYFLCSASFGLVHFSFSSFFKYNVIVLISSFLMCTFTAINFLLSTDIPAYCVFMLCFCFHLSLSIFNFYCDFSFVLFVVLNCVV